MGEDTPLSEIMFADILRRAQSRANRATRFICRKSEGNHPAHMFGREK